jgi:hypothetical protein
LTRHSAFGHGTVEYERYSDAAKLDHGPQVTIRDLVLGAELAASTKDRADYLELRAGAVAEVVGI